MAKPSSITIPTESIGSIPRPVDMIERPRKATVRMPTSLLSMKMRFGIPLAVKPPSLQALRTANGGAIISVRIACIGFRMRSRMVSKSRSQTVIRPACYGLQPFRYRLYAPSKRSGDIAYDVRFGRRGVPVQATVAGDSLCP